MKEALERTIERLDTVLWVFTLIVAIGVVGEALFGIKHVLLSKRLRHIQHDEDQRHQGEMAELRKAADSALRDAEGFRLQIALANERAANAERETARLTKAAEDERSARIKIEERMAWRRITARQHDEFVSALKPYGGSVVGLRQLGDEEAKTFADDIMKVFDDSGWTVAKSYSGIVSPPPYGLICIVDDRTPAGKELGALLKTLPTANVRFAPVRDGVASIFVGLKPPL
jgi:hypothetical protein